MSTGLAKMTESRRAGWERDVVGRRHLKFNGPRRELYRLQTWEGEPSTKGTRLYFTYSVDVVGLGPAVEKVKLVIEEGRWRVLGSGLLVQAGQVDRLNVLMDYP